MPLTKRGLEGDVVKAIKKAIVDFTNGKRDITLDDLRLTEQIERELEVQGLLRPQGCDCGRYERRS